MGGHNLLTYGTLVHILTMPLKDIVNSKSSDNENSIDNDNVIYHRGNIYKEKDLNMNTQQYKNGTNDYYPIINFIKFDIYFYIII